jgi:hypothetical protein
MTSTLPRRTAAVTALAVAAFSGVALAGAAVSASAAPKAHTSLSIRAAKNAINPGGGDTISGDLRARAGHNAGRRIALLEKAKGTTTWTKDAVHRTGRQGFVAFAVSPTATTRYRLQFFGNKFQQGTRSGVVMVRVLDTTSLTISPAATSINPGDTDTINGVLSLDGAALVGDTVNLLGRQDHNKFANLGSAVTASDGSVSFSVTPPATSHYVLVFKKTATDRGARSAVATVHVRQSSSLSIRARSAKKTGKELISGDLRGGGHALAHRKVMLQDQPFGSSTWTTVATKRTGHGGGVGFTQPAPSSTENYQLVFSGGGLYDGCQSGVVTVTVAS